MSGPPCITSRGPPSDTSATLLSGENKLELPPSQKMNFGTKLAATSFYPDSCSRKQTTRFHFASLKQFRWSSRFFPFFHPFSKHIASHHMKKQARLNFLMKSQTPLSSLFPKRTPLGCVGNGVVVAWGFSCLSVRFRHRWQWVNGRGKGWCRRFPAKDRGQNGWIWTSSFTGGWAFRKSLEGCYVYLKNRI